MPFSSTSRLRQIFVLCSQFAKPSAQQKHFPILPVSVYDAQLKAGNVGNMETNLSSLFDQLERGKVHILFVAQLLINICQPSQDK